MAKYEYDVNIYDFNRKDKCVRHEIDYMLIRCLKMFKYTNLPDSIPERTLELFLQTGGVVAFTDKPDGKLRVFFGGLGGEPDEYYRPTLFTVANPALNYSANLSIIWDKDQEGDCVVMRNDGLLKGLMPLHRKYATMRVENELSLKVADINSRMPFLLAADDERTRKSAEEYLRNIYDGKLGVINNAAFLEGLKEYQLSTQHHMLFNGLIEYEQYIKSSWFGDLGLNSMFNMKKEAISESEKQMSEDELLPLVDDMLEERRRALEIINKKYGTNIEVDFSSSWKDNVEEIELNHEVLEAEANEGMDQDTEGEDIISEDEVESEETTDLDEETAPAEEAGGEDKPDSVEINIDVEVNTDESEEQNEDTEEEEVEDE